MQLTVPISDALRVEGLAFAFMPNRPSILLASQNQKVKQLLFGLRLDHGVDLLRRGSFVSQWSFFLQ